jgi:hypothetical protein
MYIDYPYFVNYGDSDAKLHADPTLLYRFGRDTHDAQLKHLAAVAFQYQQAHQYHARSAAANKGKNWPLLGGNGDYFPYPYRWGVLNRALLDLPAIDALMQTPPKQPLIRDAWLPDAQIMIARSENGSNQGFYLMAKAGTNGANHNHNDVGNYIVFYDGEPVLIDAGAQTYTKKTFSGRRYQIWNSQSRYHNLPDINGEVQHNEVKHYNGEGFGERKHYRAHHVRYHKDDAQASLTMDIAGAYPDAANVKSWVRTITLNRGKNVAITENYSLKKFIKPLMENFLTPYRPDVSHDGKIVLRNASRFQYVIDYDPSRFTPHYNSIAVNDQRMTSSWGRKLYHIVLQSKEHRLHGQYAIEIGASAKR